MAFDYIIISAVLFGQNIIGIVACPYETYRRIARNGKISELAYIGALLLCYFGLASFIRVSSFRPFLLTKHVFLLFGTAAVSYCIITATLWFLSRIFGGRGFFKQFAIAWGYTLIPTTVWFFITSILYMILPPPRTERLLGILFSIVYLTVTSMLFLWKCTLCYLALRFGMKLDLQKIIAVAVLSTPFFVSYSLLMYRFGIFRVPFI